jgi:antitoxin component YwqK of YwqJK toxin-antitoxin module
MTAFYYFSKIKIILTLVFLISLQSFGVMGQSSNKTDALGRKQGEWKRYQGAILKSIGNYKDDLPEGTFTYFNEDGTIKAKSIFSDGAKRISFTNFYSLGIIKSEGTYYNKKKDGEWRYYAETKTLLAIENYKSGLKEGLWKNFYRSGKIALEAYYLSDLKSGMWKYYFPDGQIKSVINYLNDKLNGVATYYYPGVKVMILGEYVNEEKNGKWLYYDMTGKTLRKEEYKTGELLSSEGVVFSVNDSIKLPEPERF